MEEEVVGVYGELVIAEGLLGVATEEEGFDSVGVSIVVWWVDGVALVEGLDGGEEELGGGLFL